MKVENAEVVDAVIGPEISRVPLSEILGDRAHAIGDGQALIVAPHRHGTDGFFAQVLKRSA
jgi:16S rRNA (cytosine967-C5)-methyltransferase